MHLKYLEPYRQLRVGVEWLSETFVSLTHSMQRSGELP